MSTKQMKCSDSSGRTILECRHSFFLLMKSIIRSMKLRGQARTAETYATTLSSFTRFRRGKDLSVRDVDSTLIETYEVYLQRCGLVPNTTSFYMRVLRAAYNRAVVNKIISDKDPFRNVYTGVDTTQKRAIPLTALRRIRALNLSPAPKTEYARDMFMLSFYLRGMSFVDMAYLRKTDLNAGQLIYRRRKTGRLLSIQWTREMQNIIDKYSSFQTDYLLPIIPHSCNSERAAYRNAAYNINRRLKDVAREAKITMPLTLYCARHSWASVALSKGIPLSVISEGMGHDSETTTRIYLSSINSPAVDKANAVILNSLK